MCNDLREPFDGRRLHHLLLRRLGRTVAHPWLLTGSVPVVSVTPAQEQRAKEILARHGDKDWTLCAAISFAVLEVRRVSRAFTYIISARDSRESPRWV